MNEAQVAELVAKTLQWAADKATEGVPAFCDIMGLDIGEVEFAVTGTPQRFRLIVEEIKE